MAATAEHVDLVKKNVTRLGLVQALLLVLLLGWLALSPPGSQSTLYLLLWTALLPAFIGVWGYLYYEAVRGAAASEDPEGTLKAANATAMKRLGVMTGLWLAGFVVVFVFALMA